jgi:hypothetical protein
MVADSTEPKALSQEVFFITKGLPKLDITEPLLHDMPSDKVVVGFPLLLEKK